MSAEDLIADEAVVVTLSHGGYAKAQPLSDYRAQRRGGRGKSATAMKNEDFVDKLFVASRGGQGVMDIKTTERNGAVVGAVQVREDDEIMLITDGGTLVRTAVAEVSSVGRNTQGVRLIRLTEGESLVELTAIDEGDVVDEDAEDESGEVVDQEAGQESEAGPDDEDGEGGADPA